MAPEQAQKLLTRAKQLDPRLRKMIDDLENSPHVITIICVESVAKINEISGGGNGRMNPEKGNVQGYKDSMAGGGGPGQGSTIELFCGCNGDKYKQDQGYRSSLTVLVHELQHSWDLAMAQAAIRLRKNGNPEYIDDPTTNVQESEQRSVRTENIVREQTQHAIRTTYGGDPVTNPQGRFSPIPMP